MILAPSLASLLACFAPLPASQDAPAVKPSRPTLEQLLERARSEERERKGKPLAFHARYRVVHLGLVSRWGKFRSWGAKAFRIEYEMPTQIWTYRYAFEASAERVLARVEQLDVKDGSAGKIGDTFKQLRWKEVPSGSRRVLMGLLLFHVSQPVRMLELAKSRYFDLEVRGEGKFEDGAEVWMLEAALPPHEIPPAERDRQLARVRISIGKRDLVMRRHEILDAKGVVYRANHIAGLQLGKPPGERPAALKVPPGTVVGELLPRR